MSNSISEEARNMIPQIRKDAEAFKTASVNLKMNRSFISEYPLAFKYCSDELKGDKELALSVIKKRPENFKFLSAALRRNKTFLSEVLHINPSTFQFFDEENKEKEELASLAMKLHVSSKFLPLKFQNDLSFMRNVLSFQQTKDQIFQLVESTHENLRNNKKFMLECVKRNGCSLKLVSKNLQNDEDMVFAAIENEPKSLLFASSRFREKEPLVHRCIEQSPQTIKYVSSIFLQNRNIVLSSLQRDGNLLEYIPEPLRSDAQIIHVAVLQSRDAWSFVPARLLDDENFVTAFAETFDEVFGQMSKRLKGNRSFLLHNVRRFASIVRHISAELRQDEKFLKEIYKENPATLKTYPNVFCESRKFVFMILPPSSSALQKSIETLFSKEFPKDDIYFSYNTQKQTSECVVHYGKDATLPVRQCVACTLFLKEKKMRIDYLKVTEDRSRKCNCEYSGTDLMLKLYRIAKEANLKEINLLDASRKYFRNADCSVDFQTWNALTSQGSLTWYESFGYHAKSKKKETIMKSLQSPVNSLLQKLDATRADRFRDYAKRKGIQIDAGTTLQQLGILVKRKMNEGRINCLEESGETFLKTMLNFIPRPFGVHETFSLKLNDVVTARLYSELEKKFSKVIDSRKESESTLTRKKRKRSS